MARLSNAHKSKQGLCVCPPCNNWGFIRSECVRCLLPRQSFYVVVALVCMVRCSLLLLCVIVSFRSCIVLVVVDSTGFLPACSRACLLLTVNKLVCRDMFVYAYLASLLAVPMQIVLAAFLSNVFD